MRKILNYILLIGVLVCATSCGNFLEEESQNLAYVETLTDLEEVLLGSAYIDPLTNHPGFSPQDNSGFWSHIASQSSKYFPWIHLMDDDVAQFVTGTASTSTVRWIGANTRFAFTWHSNPFLNNDSVPITDNHWKDLYARIAVSNSTLLQLEEFDRVSSGAQLYDRIEGEARFLRAMNYLRLVNLYAQPYSKATAANEMGVPLKTSGYVEDKYFARASVKEVYDEIVKDLNKASTCFQNLNITAPNRVNFTAINTLLSRVYLYMEEYELAIAAANAAINRGENQILDLNNVVVGKSVTYLNSPETLFSQGGYVMGVIHTDDKNSIRTQAHSYTTSGDLLSTFDLTDLRRATYFLKSTKTGLSYRCLKLRSLDDGVVSDQWLIRLPEAYLNKAEAQAIIGDPQAAQTLDALRIKRFKVSDFVATTLSGEDLVKFVRDERRRELCYEAHRWFDLRRYAVNSRYPQTKEIVHVYNQFIATAYFAVGEYKLKPYNEDKEAYVLPLPDYAIFFNEGVLKQNPARPIREMIPY